MSGDREGLHVLPLAADLARERASEERLAEAPRAIQEWFDATADGDGDMQARLQRFVDQLTAADDRAAPADRDDVEPGDERTAPAIRAWLAATEHDPDVDARLWAFVDQLAPDTRGAPGPLPDAIAQLPVVPTTAANQLPRWIRPAIAASLLLAAASFATSLWTGEQPEGPSTAEPATVQVGAARPASTGPEARPPLGADAPAQVAEGSSPRTPPTAPASAAPASADPASAASASTAPASTAAARRPSSATSDDAPHRVAGSPTAPSGPAHASNDRTPASDAPAVDSPALHAPALDISTPVSDPRPPSALSGPDGPALVQAASTASPTAPASSTPLRRSGDIAAHAGTWREDVVPGLDLRLLEGFGHLQGTESAPELVLADDALIRVDIDRSKVDPDFQRFTVHTRAGTVTVLGTRYSVETRSGHTHVETRRGLVKVACADGREKLVAAGQSADCEPVPDARVLAHMQAMDRAPGADSAILSAQDRYDVLVRLLSGSEPEAFMATADLMLARAIADADYRKVIELARVDAMCALGWDEPARDAARAWLRSPAADVDVAHAREIAETGCD